MPSSRSSSASSPTATAFTGCVERNSIGTSWVSSGRRPRESNVTGNARLHAGCRRRRRWSRRPGSARPRRPSATAMHRSESEILGDVPLPRLAAIAAVARDRRIVGQADSPSPPGSGPSTVMAPSASPSLPSSGSSVTGSGRDASGSPAARCRCVCRVVTGASSKPVLGRRGDRSMPSRRLRGDDVGRHRDA